MKKLSEILKKIRYTSQHDELRYTILNVDSLVTRSKPYYDAVCFSLNSTWINGTTEHKYLFKKIPGKVEVLFEDNNLVTHRRITGQQLNYFGDKMTLTLRRDTKLCPIYDVEVRQEIYAEADHTKNCSVYPNSQYVNYDECDLAFTLRRYQAIYGSPIVPIWATDDDSKVTTQYLYKDTIGHANKRARFVAGGLKLFPCKLPCTLTKTTTQLASIKDCVGECWHHSEFQE